MSFWLCLYIFVHWHYWRPQRQATDLSKYTDGPKLHPRTHLLPDHFSSLRWQSGGESYYYYYISKISDTNNYTTRGSFTDFSLYRFKSCMGRYSFLYSAAVLWNGLPLNHKLLSSSYFHLKSSIVAITTAVSRSSRGRCVWRDGEWQRLSSATAEESRATARPRLLHFILL